MIRVITRESPEIFSWDLNDLVGSRKVSVDSSVPLTRFPLLSSEKTYLRGILRGITMSKEDDRLSLRRLPLYCPTWEGPIETWAKLFIHRNVWRTTPLYDFDDLYNELFMKFMYCCRLYPRVVDEPHFIVLFQRAAHSLLNTLSGRRGKERAAIRQETTVDAMEEREELVGDDEVAAAIWSIDLSEAPIEVRKLFERIPSLEPNALYTRRNRHFRETTEQFLRRLLGEEPGIPLAPAVTSFLCA